MGSKSPLPEPHFVQMPSVLWSATCWKILPLAHHKICFNRPDLFMEITEEEEQSLLKQVLPQKQAVSDMHSVNKQETETTTTHFSISSARLVGCDMLFFHLQTPWQWVIITCIVFLYLYTTTHRSKQSFSSARTCD